MCEPLRAFTRNDYGPDICYWSLEKAKHFSGEMTVCPVPDFICEVLSPSTERRDRSLKFDDYAAHGVLEYWLVDPAKRTIEQFVLTDGKYDLIGRFTSGVINSRAIPGFQFQAEAAFDEDINLRAMGEILMH
jgi:Uma2 family endonuclease